MSSTYVIFSFLHWTLSKVPHTPTSYSHSLTSRSVLTTDWFSFSLLYPVHRFRLLLFFTEVTCDYSEVVLQYYRPRRENGERENVIMRQKDFRDR